MATTKKYVSLEKLGLYDEKIKKVISDGDAASIQSAKDYADGLAGNYDAAGAAATAEANAKAYADGKDEAIAAAKKAGDDAAAAAGVADGKAVAAQAAADKAQGEVDALETYVGTIPEGAASTNVVAYVQEKTAGIATSENLQELTNRVAQAETDIDNIEKDYLKAADKTELQGKIDAEAERAAGIEGGLETRLKAVEDDYLKAADKTELQGNIDTLTGVVNTLRDGVDAEKVDGVKDLIDYVEEHGTEVTGMKEDISKNAEDIAGVAGRMTTAEGKITAVEGAVATKAEAQALADAVEALEGVDAGLDERLQLVEAQLGDGENSVSDLIADAKQEAIDTAAGDATTKANKALEDAKAYADAEDAKIESRVDALETASATHALASDLTALAGRVTTAEGEIDTLQTEMDAVEALAAANKSAHEANAAAIALKASQADLEALEVRVAANEAGLASFVEVSEEEINAMFA